MRARIITAGDLVTDGTEVAADVEHGVVLKMRTEGDLVDFIKRAAMSSSDPVDDGEWGFDIVVGRDLGAISHDVAAWQLETFGDAATPHGAVEHLRREANEVWSHFWRDGVRIEVDEVDRDEVAEECADVFFLLVQLATTIGISLADAVDSKLAKNKRRKWKKPDASGVVEHESEGGAP